MPDGWFLLYLHRRKILRHIINILLWRYNKNQPIRGMQIWLVKKCYYYLHQNCKLFLNQYFIQKVLRFWREKCQKLLYDHKFQKFKFPMLYSFFIYENIFMKICKYRYKILATFYFEILICSLHMENTIYI